MSHSETRKARVAVGLLLLSSFARAQATTTTPLTVRGGWSKTKVSPWKDTSNRTHTMTVLRGKLLVGLGNDEKELKPGELFSYDGENWADGKNWADQGIDGWSVQRGCWHGGG